jgi:hypothetical protein
MLKIVNTTVEQEDDYTVTRHTVEGYAELDGTSIWDYNYDTHGMRVNVSTITVIEEEEGYRQVNVEHDSGWEIYTDKGFERNISDVLGFEVGFTEQGMQDDNYASMETA